MSAAASTNLEPLLEQRVTLVRGFEMPLADAWDGRTLDVRIVPYNVPATVADPPHFQPYREMFVPGVFERQLSTPGRDKVWLNVEHEQGFGGAVGRSLRFSDGPDGLHGSFGVIEGPDGDKALQLVTSGFLAGLSLEFRALASRRVDGVVQRMRAHLDKVSLCRYPAYESAQVLALREQHELEGELEHELEAPEPEPPQPPQPPEVEPLRSSELDARLGLLGFEPLMRAAVTSKPWDGSPARFSDEQYKRAALLCRGQSDAPKTDCSLPVREPDGTLNANALGAAAAALAGGRGGLANVPLALKARAARLLIRYYGQAGMEPPESVRRLAASA